jgi:phage terminase large subunit-like protein
MADNVVVSTDPAGNLKPNKQKSREKIDGIVAGVMALDRAVRHSGTRNISADILDKDWGM